MMRKYLFLFAFYLSSINTFPQIQISNSAYKVPVTFIQLPARLHETSGLIFYNNLLWTFNDSGGKPKIFGVSYDDGKIQKILKIKSACNFDWEDISQDDNFIYIGDFGNNLGNRKRLKIYKIPKPAELFNKRVKLKAELIEYNYEDQVSFKMKLNSSSFDCEAMVSYNDSLVIFTKDWQNKNSTVYILPKLAGKYNAKKICTIPVNGLITGAELIPEKSMIYLVGRNDLFPFILILKYSNYLTINNGVLFELPFLHGMQIEAITYNEGIIYLSAESSLFPQRIYVIRDLPVDF